MANWQTISSLATGAGALVLAVATFWAVRSSNRSARIAEQALRAGMRPLLVQSRAADPEQKVLWQDRHTVHLTGGRAIVEEQDGVIYLAMGVRNAGAGIALLHGWYPMPERAFVNESARRSHQVPPPHHRSLHPAGRLRILGRRPPRLRRPAAPRVLERHSRPPAVHD